MARREIVEDAHARAAPCQSRGDVRADEARAARHENFSYRVQLLGLTVKQESTDSPPKLGHLLGAGNEFVTAGGCRRPPVCVVRPRGKRYHRHLRKGHVPAYAAYCGIPAEGRLRQIHEYQIAMPAGERFESGVAVTCALYVVAHRAESAGKSSPVSARRPYYQD